MPRSPRVPRAIDVNGLIAGIARPLDEKTRVYTIMVAVGRAAGAVKAFKAGHLEVVPVRVLAVADREVSPDDDEGLKRAEELVLPRYVARRALNIEWAAMNQAFPELGAIGVHFEHHLHVLADVIADNHGSGKPGELGRWVRQAYEEDQAERKAHGEPTLADAPSALRWDMRTSRTMLAFYNLAFDLQWAEGEIPWSNPRTLEQGFKNWLSALYRQLLASQRQD